MAVLGLVLESLEHRELESPLRGNYSCLEMSGEKRSSKSKEKSPCTQENQS